MWETTGLIFKGIVAGIITPILNWFSTYEYGKTAQRLDDAKATLAQQQAISDAHNAAGRLDTGADWLRRDSSAQTPPGPDSTVPPGSLG